MSLNSLDRESLSAALDQSLRRWSHLFVQGVERECLRVTEPNGEFSHTPHAPELGHKLTHPYITTDYCENLLEFITPPLAGTSAVCSYLAEIHYFTLNKLPADEYFWNHSLPPKVSESEIQCADFGKSYSGQLKTLYRDGLGHRYGKVMQSVAGIHYNVSFHPFFLESLFHQTQCSGSFREFCDSIYFGLIRRFKEKAWMFIALFGASPVCDESFLIGRDHQLDSVGGRDFGTETSVSLRNGHLGYVSDVQDELSISYKSIDDYVAGLEEARLMVHPPYLAIDKSYPNKLVQLNPNKIQIDNEFYSNIRPKKTAQSGQSSLQALDMHGVEYLELRLLDVDPFCPWGISERTLKFCQLFLLTNLIDIDEPKSRSGTEFKERNEKIAEYGLDEQMHGQLEQELNRMHEVIQSNSHLRYRYAGVLGEIRAEFDQGNLVSDRLKKDRKTGESFLEQTTRLSLKQAKYFRDEFIPNKKIQKQLQEMSQRSWEIAERLDNNIEQDSFEDYLKHYFEQIKINS